MKYYTPSKILSYKMPINFIVGTRSAGKSYSVKHLVLHKYIKHKKRFIYIYKTDVALEKKAKGYFYDILKNNYKDYELKYISKNSEYQIKKKGDTQWHICGYAYSLKDLSDLSGKADLETCDTIVYDEFMSKNKNKFISPETEVELLLQLYVTVARGVNQLFRKNVRLIFLANAFTLANPFFIHYGLDTKIRFNKNYYIDNKQSVAVEMAVNDFVLEAVKNTKFYKSIKGSKFEQFAYDNKFLLDIDVLIKKRPKKSTPMFKFIVDNKTYILYSCNNYMIFDNDNKLYNNNDVIDTYVLTDENLKPNYYKIDLFKKTKVYKRIIDIYQTSKLYFTNQTAYQTFLFMFNL